MLLDAAALRDRARRLRAVCTDLRRVLDDATAVRHLAGRVTWVGPTADHFVERIGVQIRDLERLIDQLRLDARRLDTLADTLAVG